MAEYLKNKDLLIEVLHAKSLGYMTPELIQMFELMIHKYMKGMSYKHPDDAKDCFSGAMLYFCLYWKNFNPETSSNPFSFYTSVLRSGMANGWKELHPIKDSERVSFETDDGVFNL